MLGPETPPWPFPKIRFIKPFFFLCGFGNRNIFVVRVDIRRLRIVLDDGTATALVDESFEGVNVVGSVWIRLRRRLRENMLLLLSRPFGLSCRLLQSVLDVRQMLRDASSFEFAKDDSKR